MVYDVISYDAVQWLKEHPPMVDHTYYAAEQYRFMQPIHNLELGISGLREIQGAKHTLDRYFRVKYGPTALRASRLELGGDVYTMVLESWEVTRQVIHDPFTAFTDSLLSRFFTVSNPLLLYTMNTAGIPTNPAYLTSAAPSSQGSSMEFRAIRAEIDDVRQQGITAMGSVTNSIQRFQTVTSELVEQGKPYGGCIISHVPILCGIYAS